MGNGRSIDNIWASIFMVLCSSAGLSSIIYLPEMFFTPRKAFTLTLPGCMSIVIVDCRYCSNSHITPLMALRIVMNENTSADGG